MAIFIALKPKAFNCIYVFVCEGQTRRTRPSGREIYSLSTIDITSQAECTESVQLIHKIILFITFWTRSMVASFIWKSITGPFKSDRVTSCHQSQISQRGALKVCGTLSIWFLWIEVFLSLCYIKCTLYSYPLSHVLISVLNFTVYFYSFSDS